jgi:hypothetical protein
MKDAMHNVTTAIQVQILTALISEDRQEIRDLRQSLQNSSTLLGTASFAITAFLVDKPNQHHLFLFCDVLLGVFLLLAVVRAMTDLRHARRCLFARQGLLKNSDITAASFNPFPRAEGVKPDINDLDQLSMPGLVALAVIAKDIFLVCRGL